MVIGTRDEYLKRIGDHIGESDEDIAFLEDMTDTYDSLSSGSDREELQRLSAENEELRRKYKERFFTYGAPGSEDPEPGSEDPEPGKNMMTSFDDLFEIKKEEK